MGRGDKRTAKGKRFKGSFGNSRPHKVKTTGTGASSVTKKPKAKKEKESKTEKAPKKTAAKKAPKKKAE